MTMPIRPGAQQPIEPSFPRITLILTDPVVPTGNNEPLSWVLGDVHPFVKSAKIVAMYDSPDSIDVYSTAPGEGGTQHGLRDRLPIKYVRFIREMMPIDVFAVELAQAELADDTDDDEDEDDGAEDGAPRPATAPAQA